MKNKIPIPEYHTQEQISYCGCGADYKNPCKEDCYFYHGEPSMGGYIPCCKLQNGLGNCPCENFDAGCANNCHHDLREKSVRGGEWLGKECD